MKIFYTPHFTRNYNKAPKAASRPLTSRHCCCSRVLRHPSLHAKKYDESQNLWQGRVTGSWRFYFLIEGDVYLMTEIKAHPKK